MVKTEDEETDDHIIWCNTGDRLSSKQLWEADVFHYLSESHTVGCTFLGFHHWIYHKAIPPLLRYVPTASQELQQAYRAQTTIVGWNQFLRGRLSGHWQQLIVNHLATLPPPDPEEKWQKKKKQEG